MIREIIDIPSSIMRVTASDLEINVRGRGGSTSVTGVDQVVYGSQPRWEGEVSIILPCKNDVLLWRVLYSKLRGRVNLFRIGIVDPHGPQINGANGDTGTATAAVPHSDDAYFSDGSGYAYKPVVLTTVAFSMGATSVSIDATAISDSLQPGHYVTIDDWTYRIVGMSGSITSRTYSIEPPLRRDLSIGSQVLPFATIIGGFEGDLPANPKLGVGQLSGITFKIIEWINRP